MKNDATPWGWIAATAYVTTLAFAFFSQWFGSGSVENFVYSYQTLIAGIIAFAGVWVAIRQSRTASSQWRFEKTRQILQRADALAALFILLQDYAQRANARHVASALVKTRSGYSELPIDRNHWQNLASQLSATIQQEVHMLATAVDALNRYVMHANYAALGPLEEDEHITLSALSEDVAGRNRRVWDLLTAEHRSIREDLREVQLH